MYRITATSKNSKRSRAACSNSSYVGCVGRRGGEGDGVVAAGVGV